MKQYNKLFLNMCFLLMMSMSASAMLLIEENDIGEDEKPAHIAHFHIKNKPSDVKNKILKWSFKFKKKPKKPNAKKFKCAVCRRQYVRKNAYLKHLAIEHSHLSVAEEPYLCPILIVPPKDCDTTKTTNAPSPAPGESNLGFKKSSKKPEEIDLHEYLKDMFPGEQISEFIFRSNPQNVGDFTEDEY